MKQVIMFVTLMLVTLSTYAVDLPKDTLHVERFALYQNGTSSGKSLAQHTFIKRYYTPEDCILAKTAYNAETVLNIGGNNMTVLTIAKCEAINHSIYQ